MIFRRFLLYLYGAPVDKNVGVESLCELMLLADRYSVDSLKVKSLETLFSMEFYDNSNVKKKIFTGDLRANVDVNDR